MSANRLASRCGAAATAQLAAAIVLVLSLSLSLQAQEPAVDAALRCRQLQDEGQAQAAVAWCLQASGERPELANSAALLRVLMEARTTGLPPDARKLALEAATLVVADPTADVAAIDDASRFASVLGDAALLTAGADRLRKTAPDDVRTWQVSWIDHHSLGQRAAGKADIDRAEALGLDAEQVAKLRARNDSKVPKGRRYAVSSSKGPRDPIDGPYWPWAVGLFFVPPLVWLFWRPRRTTALATLRVDRDRLPPPAPAAPRVQPPAPAAPPPPPWPDPLPADELAAVLAALPPHHALERHLWMQSEHVSRRAARCRRIDAGVRVGFTRRSGPIAVIELSRIFGWYVREADAAASAALLDLARASVGGAAIGADGGTVDLIRHMEAAREVALLERQGQVGAGTARRLQFLLQVQRPPSSPANPTRAFGPPDHPPGAALPQLLSGAAPVAWSLLVAELASHPDLLPGMAANLVEVGA